MTTAPEAVRPSRNPGAAHRAARQLTADPARSDRLVGLAAGCDPRTVRRIRHELEASGEIPPAPHRASRTPLPQRPGRARIAIARGARTTRDVMTLAGVSRSMAWRALHDRQTGLAEAAAASDSLSVTALARCARCGRLITFDPRRGPRRACSAACGTALGRELRRAQQAAGELPNRWPPVTGLPPAPDWCCPALKMPT